MAGIEGVCMVRCNNAASKYAISYGSTIANHMIDAGPFGGCVPVQMVGAGGNATAAPEAKLRRAFRG